MPLYTPRRRNAADHGARAGDPGADRHERRRRRRAGEGAGRRRPLRDRGDACAPPRRWRRSRRSPNPCRARSSAPARSSRPSRSPKRSRRGRAFWSAPALRPALAEAGGGGAGSVPARLRDGVGGDGAAGARLPRAETVSGRSGRRGEAARLARRAACPICASARPAASISPRRPTISSCRTLPASAAHGCCPRPRCGSGDYATVEALSREAAGLKRAAA